MTGYHRIKIIHVNQQLIHLYYLTRIKSVTVLEYKKEPEI